MQLFDGLRGSCLIAKELRRVKLKLHFRLIHNGILVASNSGHQQWQCQYANGCFFWERVGGFKKTWDKNVILWTERAKILACFQFIAILRPLKKINRFFGLVGYLAQD